MKLIMSLEFLRVCKVLRKNTQLKRKTFPFTFSRFLTHGRLGKHFRGQNMPEVHSMKLSAALFRGISVVQTNFGDERISDNQNCDISETFRIAVAQKYQTALTSFAAAKRESSSRNSQCSIDNLCITLGIQCKKHRRQEGTTRHVERRTLGNFEFSICSWVIMHAEKSKNENIRSVSLIDYVPGRCSRILEN
jgi:hypothetical protein